MIKNYFFKVKDTFSDGKVAWLQKLFLKSNLKQLRYNITQYIELENIFHIY